MYEYSYELLICILEMLRATFVQHMCKLLGSEVAELGHATVFEVVQKLVPLA